MRGEDTVDVVGNRSGLPFGFARTDDQIIGDRGQLGNVEDEDVGGFFVEGSPGDGEGYDLRLRYDSRPPDTIRAGLYRIQRGAATPLPGSRADGAGSECPRPRPRKGGDATGLQHWLA